MKIFKYTLERRLGEQILNLPQDTSILSFGSQGDSLVFWAKVDDNQERIPVSFHLFFTGDEITANKFLNYIGTTTTSDNLVWHLFVELVVNGWSKELNL